MKSLIIKDIYNMKSYSRQLLISLVFLGICLVPTTGSEGFVVASALMCSMMTITSFSFDERSKWEKYALIMPISRREYVLSKYALNILFGGAGVLIGCVGGTLIGIFRSSFSFETMLICAAIGLGISLVEGMITIPIILRYGSENARIIMIAGIALPGGLAFLVYKAVNYFHIELTNQLMYAAILVLVILILFGVLISYQLSKKWFYAKEF